MQTLKNIELRKYVPSAAAALLFTALLAQAPHAATVFIRIAPTDVHWEAWGLAILGGVVYAIALESATAYFVWRNKMRWAIAFAAFSIMHNVAYYMPGAWSFDIAGAELSLRYIVSALLISASLPIAIAAFSHVHVETMARDKETPQDAPQRTRKAKQVDDTTIAPIVQPSESGGHSEAAEQTSVPEVPEQSQDGKRKVPPETKAIILRSIDNGAKLTDVAAEFDVSPNTVRSWIARAPKQTNGTGVH